VTNVCAEPIVIGIKHLV